MKYDDLVFIGYARTSTKDQKRRGSIEIQVKNYKEWSETNKVNLERIYLDDGVRGWTFDRPEFQKMLIHLNRVDGLVIEHNDRFSRANPIDTLVIYNNIFQTDKIVYSIMEQELKLESLQDFLLLAIKTYESANRIMIDKKKQKDGIDRFISLNNRWGRLRKELNVKQYTELRKIGLSKTDCAKVLGMSSITLNRRLHELKINDFEEFKKKKVEI